MSQGHTENRKVEQLGMCVILLSNFSADNCTFEQKPLGNYKYVYKHQVFFFRLEKSFLKCIVNIKLEM